MLRGLFRTKNLDDILAASQEEGHTLKRALGAFNVTLIGIGAIIGAGIFATVGTAAVGDDGLPQRQVPSLADAAFRLSACLTA